MKKFICLFMLLLLAITGCAQSKILESLTFRSEILNRDVSYSIYLPENYDSSERLYPALYLLHGWTDDETAWLQMGDMQRITDKAIASGKAIPMIIIMPNAWETWYVNSYDGKNRYEDMFFQELIPYMEKRYRIRSMSQYRAIAGQSMGGYGSFLYTLHHPEMFTACAPLSAAIYTDERMEESKDSDRGKLFDKIYGPGNLTDHWQKNSVLAIMQQMNPEDFPNVYYYIDCGDDDTLLHGNNLIHEIMQKNRVKHEFRVRDGGHSWTYWRAALPKVLQFVSKRFNRS